MASEHVTPPPSGSFSSKYVSSDQSETAATLPPHPFPPPALLAPVARSVQMLPSSIASHSASCVAVSTEPVSDTSSSACWYSALFARMKLAHPSASSPALSGSRSMLRHPQLAVSLSLLSVHTASEHSALRIAQSILTSSDLATSR